MKEHPYFSDVYASNLDVALRQITKKNLDWFHVIDGVPGVGKSTLGTETCLYVDPTFTVDRVAYDFQEIQQIVEELGEPPESVGKAVLWDEAAEGQYAADAQKLENREVGKFFFRVRKKRLFFCNCLPYIWKLQDTSRLRAMSLAHCEFTMNEAEGLLEQGKAAFYSIFKIPEVLKNKTYGTPDFTFLFKAAPTDLWDKIQNKNLTFLDETDANAILKVKKINRFEIDCKLARIAQQALAEKLSIVLYVDNVTNLMRQQYGDSQWVTPNFISKKIKGYGFQKYRDSKGATAYIITKEGVAKLFELLHIK